MEILLESAGTIVALILSLFVFSYLLGDNILYRIAQSLFVGVAVGYAAVVAFHNVLAPKLLTPFVTSVELGDWARVLLLGIALILGLLLLTHPVRSLSWLGSVSVAFLLGVGAALAIGGALLGTLLPQASAAADVAGPIDRYGPGLGLFSSIVLFVGTLGVLVYFQFTSGRGVRGGGPFHTLVRVWGGLGRWFILVAFAAILATTFMSRLSILADRIQFFWDSLAGLGG
ncbi:MAG TPA: hypothetical protein VLC95_19420 [Anaerolineae bacterium]|jgi:hypothetical protein|nr:hypothetical protein [Anaerolineae bacterium]